MTYLVRDINAETDLIVVSAPLVNPTYPLFRSLGSESIKVVAHADTTQWQVERGVGETTATAHGKGTALIADASPFGEAGGATPDLAAVLAAGADADGAKITGLADPEDAQDAATKASSEAYADSVAGGALQSVTIDLTTAEIATLGETPVELIAAPGAGMVIVPVAASFHYLAGTEAFATSPAIDMRHDDGSWLAIQSMDLDGLNSRFLTFAASEAGGDQGDVEDVPVILEAESDPGMAGPIVAAVLNQAGSGYAPGDTGTIDAGNLDATYEIDTVGGGGEVLTFTVTAAGTRYGVAVSVVTTVVTGAGDGAFTTDITEVTPLSDGTARLTVLYYVMELLT